MQFQQNITRPKDKCIIDVDECSLIVNAPTDIFYNAQVMNKKKESDWSYYYHYEVLPENQCRGLQVWCEEQGHNRFIGFVQYSELYKSFYLTIDGITCTLVNDAFNIKPIYDEEEL